MTSHDVNGHGGELRTLDLSYTSKLSEETARDLVYTIQPKWRETPDDIEIVKFTDGITNTLLKLARKGPGMSQSEVDSEVILMRAYGNNTEILIDRDREARSHALLADRGLAPPLLARFKNGLLYRYIPGQVCTPHDLMEEQTWRLVAAHLGEWHARLPIDSVSGKTASTNGTTAQTRNDGADSQSPMSIATRQPSPHIWTVMQKWVSALPTGSAKQQARKELLQQELDRSFDDLDNTQGPGKYGMVFGHCDLLSANVIKTQDSGSDGKSGVAFIDYEYATPCPAAFDIANHFAEWGGYDCDYNMLPTRSIRRTFLREYLTSYNTHANYPVPESTLGFLEKEVDRYRGIPGLYWGIWALIQATISQIDFDYASYAEVRLGEYFAWRGQEGDKRGKDGVEIPLRERRWAED